MSEIIVDRARMWDLFDVLIHAWRSRLPPYDKVVQVPSRLPGTLIRGSLAHARWLFNACYYMRGKINSATALIKLSHLYEVQPWMFDPSQFTEAEGARIEVLEALNSGGLGFNAEETSRFWVENFQKLHRFWDGNPINFYEKSDSYEDLCKILIAQKKSKDNPNGFFAFRHKMVSMLSYFFAKAGIINPLKHPPPIDFHWCRVMVATEAVKMKNMGPGTRFNFEELGAVIRPLTLEYCKDASAILDLADAVWHLSRSFCSMDHGNSSHQGVYNARRTAITPKARIWTASAERRFHRTCGQCVLKDACKWNIPSAHNYIEGKIVVRGARLKPLDLFVD